MKRAILGALALGALALAAYPAAAAGVTFHLTHDADSYRWALPQSPTPDYADDASFDVGGPAFGAANGQLAVFSNFTFYTAAADGGLEFDFLGGLPELGDASAASFFGAHFDLFGPQLFSGDTSAPTFQFGEYDLVDGGGDCGCDSFTTQAVGQYHLSISGGVPEPATWALMIAGFGGAGVALRRQRRQVVA
ncbi:PEPxxWA-CTERM sorting domain-containing protein [Phenylobacterium sp.]|uniref:PEPxxWA-CTERM sorting domain-containing protein n=1 Tax=Phenylobacterium sp. TaxID=1871053 RepID=UPI0025DE2D49|nr:PEPxxWA-CTERM sorting domain-containing protein [Phenylobacterium sp.]